MTDVRSIGDDLRAIIVSLRASSRSSAQELRNLSKALRKREAELDELNSKLDVALKALPTEAVEVPRLSNSKKALTLIEIDQIADLERQGYPTDWIASQAGCSDRNIRMIVQIAGFSKDIRSAIADNISSAHFALRLVNRNGELKTSIFLRKVTEWYRDGGSKLRRGNSLLSMASVAKYADMIGLKPLSVK